jgi:hypothetical protein
MKLSEIIKRLDKSETNEDYVDITYLATKFDIYDNLVTYDVPNIKIYWIAKHLCTDTWVGLRAYFIDGELFAVTRQNARKSDEEFKWVSEYMYEYVRLYILSLTEKDEHNFELVDMEEDIGEFYPIHYAGQFLKHDVTYNGKPAKIIRQNTYEFKEPCVLIRVDNEEKWVYPSDIQTQFNLV